MQSLWNIKVVVLVKPEHENRISHVSTSSVKTGIANTLGRGTAGPRGTQGVCTALGGSWGICLMGGFCCCMCCTRRSMCTLHDEESWYVGIAWGGVPVCVAQGGVLLMHREGSQSTSVA